MSQICVEFSQKKKPKKRKKSQEINREDWWKWEIWFFFGKDVIKTSWETNGGTI
jgi:hypothetical protein